MPPASLTTCSPDDVFVGRKTELESVSSAMRASRMVTITGPSGIGKTRLAFELLRRNAQRPVNVIDLTATSGDRDLAEVFAEELQIQDEVGEELLTTIARTLDRRRPLLLVDNCGHVAEPTAVMITRLLERCPELRVLATTREMLRVPGEIVHQLQPLLASEAEQLFLERARATDPGFRLTDEVTRLCRELDGVPLAVELAASRLRSATTEEIAAAVHQDVSSTLEWSYRQLTPDAQEVLRRLSVCAGGFTIDAARRICADDSVLPTVLDLNTKSLVQKVKPADSLRFRMLEPIRHFALRELRARPDELASARARLAAWLEELSMPLHTEARLRHTLTRTLDAETANLSAALGHPDSRTSNVDQRALLTCALARATLFRGRFDRARRLLDSVLAGAPHSAHRPIALGLHAWLAMSLGRHDAALQYAVEAVAVTRSANTPLTLRAFNQLGAVLLAQRRVTTSVIVHRRMLRIAEKLGEPLVIASCRQNLAWVLLQDDEWSEARELVDKALTTFRLEAPPVEHGSVLHTSATIHLWHGNLAAARHHLEEVLRGAPTDSLNRAYVLEGLAIIAQRCDAFSRSALLFAIADASRAELGLTAVPMWQAWVDEARAHIAGALTKRQLMAAAERAAEMDDKMVLKFALSSGLGTNTPLTAREHEITTLLAEGLSNRDIAARLGIAGTTVNNVLNRIKQKLGVYSRAELITWHLEHAD